MMNDNNEIVISEVILRTDRAEYKQKIGEPIPCLQDFANAVIYILLSITTLGNRILIRMASI